MKALTELFNEVCYMHSYTIEMAYALRRWNEFIRFLGEKERGEIECYERGDPAIAQVSLQYESFYSELTDISCRNRVHEITLRKTVIALMCSIWEDQYRRRIARECGRSHENGIESAVFRDLARYRGAILDPNGTSAGEIRAANRNTLGHDVLLSDENMHEIFLDIISEIRRIGNEYYGKNPDFIKRDVI